MWPIVAIFLLFFLFLVILAALSLSNGWTQLQQQQARIDNLVQKVCTLEDQLAAKKSPLTLLGTWSINPTGVNAPLTATGMMLFPGITPQGSNAEIATVRGVAQSDVSSVIPAVRRGKVRFVSSEIVSQLTAGSATATLYVNGIAQVTMFTTHTPSDTSTATISSGADVSFNALDLLSVSYDFSAADFTETIPPVVLTAQLWGTYY